MLTFAALVLVSSTDLSPKKFIMIRGSLRHLSFSSKPPGIQKDTASISGFLECLKNSKFNNNAITTAQGNNKNVNNSSGEAAFIGFSKGGFNNIYQLKKTKTFSSTNRRFTLQQHHSIFNQIQNCRLNNNKSNGNYNNNDWNYRYSFFNKINHNSCFGSLSLLTSFNNSKAASSSCQLIGIYSQPLFSRAASSISKTKSGSASVVEGAMVSKQPISTSIKDGSLRRLLSLAGPDKFYILGGLSLLIISSLVSMSIPFGIGKVIDVVFKEGDGVEHLREYSLVITSVFLVGASANFGRIYLFNCAAQNIVARVRKSLFSSIMKQEAAFFDVSPSGELINRLSSDSQLVGSILTTNVSDGMRSLAQSGAGFCMMWYMSPTLTSVVIGVVPIVGGLAMVYGRFVKKISKRVQDQLAIATQVGSERIINIKTVKSFAKEQEEIAKYFKCVDDVKYLGYKEALAKGMFFGTTGLSGNLIVLSVLWYGGSMMQAGLLTVGNLTSFLLYTAYLGVSVVGFSNSYGELMKGVGVSKRLFELIDRNPTIATEGGTCIPVKDFKGAVMFNDVHFGYASRDKELFSGLNMSIPAGTTVGIVGKSGLGKSTLGALLSRFYEIENGSITIDGYDIRDLDPQWLRSRIGLVSQDPVLFSGSIYDNIAYANPSAPRSRVIETAKQAYAHDFISGFPDGYNTHVGEGGRSLSGGQRQRIAIARALLKDPKILILDEATSSLDNTSERLVQEALEKHLLINRTVIIITHRLSTVKNVDKIGVLSGNKIMEEGTYNELCSYPNSLFSQMLRDRDMA